LYVQADCKSRVECYKAAGEDFRFLYLRSPGQDYRVRDYWYTNP
jgi:hypothetical protein